MIEKLAAILYDQTGESSIAISEDTVLLADLGLNSFDLVNMICAVEDEFDVEIPDRVIPTLKTVGDIIAFIQEQ